MPAPTSLNSGACSRSCTGQPFCASASAAASPPMPPPTMSTCPEFSAIVSTLSVTPLRTPASGRPAHRLALPVLPGAIRILGRHPQRIGDLARGEEADRAEDCRLDLLPRVVLGAY